MKKRLLTLLWYVFYTFIVFEVFARIAYAIPYTSDRLTSLDEYSWRRRWVKQQNNKASFPYSFDDFHPSTGWISKPNIKNEALWINKYLNTNAKRLRGTKDFTYEKPVDKKRILVIGDSFTFGQEVSDDETYSHFLQERFPNAEVINMGIHGYGHDQMLVLLKEEGLKYQPDIVVLGFLMEDMSRNMLSFRDYAKPKYKIRGDQLVLTNSPVPKLETTLKWDWIRPRVLDIWAFVRYTAREKNGKHQKEMEKITGLILKEIAETTKSIGATPVFIYLPYGTETMSVEENIPGEKYLMETCRTNGIQHCLTSRTHFIPKIKAGAKFRTEHHWFAPAHKTIMESIAEYLLEHNLIEEPIGNEK